MEARRRKRLEFIGQFGWGRVYSLRVGVYSPDKPLTLQRIVGVAVVAGRAEVTRQNLRYSERLVEIPQRAHRILVDRPASTGTAWACPCFGGLMTRMDAVYCIPECASAEECRQPSLTSKERGKRIRGP